MNIADALELHMPVAGSPMQAKGTASGMVKMFSGMGDIMGGYGSTDCRAFYELFMASPFVYRAVLAKANEFAQVQLKLVNKKGEEKPKHPAYKMLQRPDKMEGYTMFDLMQMASMHWDIGGVVYLYLDLGKGRGRTKRLRILDPRWVYEEGENSMQYRYDNPHEPNRGVEVLDSKYLIRKPVLGGSNMNEVMSALRASYTAARMQQMGEQWNTAFMANAGFADKYIKIPEDLPSEQKAYVLQQFSKKYEGIANRGKNIVTELEMDFQNIGDTPRDMEFATIEDWTMKKILAAIGVPPTLVSSSDGVNYTNAIALERSFIRNIIKPRLRKFVEMLNCYYLPLFVRTDGLHFTYTDPTPEVRAEVLQGYLIRTQTGSITPNEIRAMEGDEPWEGRGDEPLNEPFTLPDLAIDGDDEDESEEETAAGQQKKIQTTAFDWPAYHKRLDKGETQIVRGMQRFFVKQQKSLLKRLGKADKALDPDDVGKILFDVEAEGGVLESIMRRVLLGIAVDEARSAQQQFNLPLFVPANADFGKSMQAQMQRFAQPVNETTWKALRDQLAAGIDAGEGIPKLKKRVEAVYDGATGYRSVRIARTEAVTAANNGRFGAYKQNGVERKQWLSQGDARDGHQSASTQGAIPIDQPFNVGGEQMMYPGDPAGSAGNVANCRCTLLPVLE